MNKELVQAVLQGDPLSDDDLKKALKFFKNMDENMTKFGPEFSPFQKFLRTEVDRLESYRENRRADRS